MDKLTIKHTPKPSEPCILCGLVPGRQKVAHMWKFGSSQALGCRNRHLQAYIWGPWLHCELISCAWFPDSKRIVCGSSDPEKGICMWDCDGTEMKAWRGMRMPKVLDLSVTSDGVNLISIFSDKEIRILNLRTNAEQVILEEHSITSLSVSMDSKVFIVNLNSQEIHLRDVAGKWAKPLKYTGHKQNKHVIHSCFGGVDSMFIASGSEDTQTQVQD